MNRTTQYLFLALFYLIAYIYAIELAPAIAKSNSEFSKKINSVHESCIYGNKNISEMLSGLRGKNYVIGKENSPEIQQCVFTFWGLTHFILYSILGFIFPDLFIETFAIGILFELYEYHAFRCHDVADIFINSAGFGLGWLIRRKLIDGL